MYNKKCIGINMSSEQRGKKAFLEFCSRKEKTFMNEKKTVALIFGGSSSEYKISLLSTYSVLKNISKEIYEVIKVGITPKGVWFVYNGDIEKIKDGTWIDDKENLVPAVISPCTVQHGLFLFNKAEMKFETKRIDVAFPLIHGKGGEDGALQGLFSLAGIPFVGCGILSSACSMNKVVAKKLCEKENIPVVDWISARKDEFSEDFIKKCEEELSYPMFVKPAEEGSSYGASKAFSREELVSSAEAAFSHGQSILIEKYIKGREIEVASFQEENDIYISSPGEIVPEDFYDYDSKYVNNTATLHVPASLDKEISEKLVEIAKKVFKTLHCKGFGRIDFFLDGEKIYFNEINTIPGFTNISMYPKLMEHDGISYTDLITKLIESASL